MHEEKIEPDIEQKLPGGFDKTLAFILFPASFLGQFGIASINLGLIFYLRSHFKLSSQVIGFSASIYTLTYFLGCLGFKRLIAAMRPRHSVEIAAAGMAAALFIILQTDLLPVVFIMHAVYGFCMALLWPPVMGWLSRGKEGKVLSNTIANFNLSWSLGIVFAPYIAGTLAERSITAPMYLGIGALCLLFFIILLGTFLFPGIRAVPSEQGAQREQKENKVSDSSTPLRFLCWIGLFASYVVFGILMNIFPLYGREALGFTEGLIGLLLLFRGGVTTIFFVILGKSLWWHYHTRQILLLQVVLAVVCLLGIYAQSSIEFAFFFIVFGILFAFLYNNSIFHGVSGSITRENRMAMHEAVLTLGTIIGSSLGGTLYQYFSFSSTLLFCAIISLGGGLAQLMLLARFRTDLHKKQLLPENE